MRSLAQLHEHLVGLRTGTLSSPGAAAAMRAARRLARSALRLPDATFEVR